MVSKFLRMVRLVQRVIRTYLICREARLLAGAVLWNKIEKKFVQVMRINTFYDGIVIKQYK